MGCVTRTVLVEFGERTGQSMSANSTTDVPMDKERVLGSMDASTPVNGHVVNVMAVE